MIWSQTILEQYINDEIQENLTLEYKGAASMSKEESKKAEITKDVSAMANSAGGIIIFGIREFDKKEKRHLPERIDPIDQTIYTKEWIEQVISNIRPKVTGILIYPVQINTNLNHVVYVVDIPQSNTAHMAKDNRYYKRLNFSVYPMEDFEVRDTMGRQQHPKIEIDYIIEISKEYQGNGLGTVVGETTVCKLKIIARNVGMKYAMYVNLLIRIPRPLLDKWTLIDIDQGEDSLIEEDGKLYYEYSRSNTVRDVVDVQFSLSGAMKKYGPSRYEPILPGLSFTWEIPLCDDLVFQIKNPIEIQAEVHADDAPPEISKAVVSELKIVNLQ